MPSTARALVLLADSGDFRRDLVAATLAWICEAGGVLFDAYYSGYALGYHYGGGDVTLAPVGAPQGSTILGGRHHQHLYRVQAEMECRFVVLDGDEPLVLGGVVAGHAAILYRGRDPLGLYGSVAGWLGLTLDDTPFLIAGSVSQQLPRVAAYAYPDIMNSRAVAFAEPLPDETVDALAGRPDRKVLGLWSSEAEVTRLRGRGLAVDEIDGIRGGDDYAAVTSRVAERWSNWADGYMVGDPDLVSAWVPWLCRHRHVALYGRPQRTVIERTAPLLQAKGREVLGRQYEDGDIFRLSELGLPMELVDPNRPPLPVLGGALPAVTLPTGPTRVITEAAPSDRELRRYAEQGKVLATVVFWSGALREIETLAGVVDLVAITRLRAGVAIGARAFEYDGQASLDLVFTPLSQGGVHPYLEVLLGSSGLGPAFEGHLGSERLARYLDRAMEIIRARAGESYVPRGWYAVMDGRLERLPRTRAVREVLKRPRDWRADRATLLGLAPHGCRRGSARRRAAPRLPVRDQQDAPRLAHGDRPTVGFRRGQPHGWGLGGMVPVHRCSWSAGRPGRRAQTRPASPAGLAALVSRYLPVDLFLPSMGERDGAEGDRRAARCWGRDGRARQRHP